MQRIEDRLLRVTAALEAAGVPYAVVGGSAVAAWVASIVPAATRTTKDIDLLVRRADLDRITAELGRPGFGARIRAV
ncbi:MAG: nucleotidyltransferase family protein [Phycisphaerales bacterium]|nr:nucleotidyltransferase family protein [Phycisphaerales bacterium]